MSQDLSVGDRVVARVIKIMPFGVFVDIEGTDLVGLVKIPEISRQPIRHPAEVLAIGQMVEAEILAVSAESKQVILSIKRCQLSEE